ncbi:MAG TPA: hypothetical protein VLI90_03225 [Tepidisphaeraceae bacterium]|nr:hypothetical protein [Tepidisphaeraceae bacterium]
MGLQESRGKLARSMKDLLAQWALVRSQWNDVNAERFEREVLHMLEMDLRNASGAMDQMGALLAQIRSQCD